MLKIENIQKDYGAFTLNCSLEVKKGQITGLIGCNGAGKSTTFKAILGLISLDGGKITFEGKEIKNLTSEEKEKIGVVLSESGFNGLLNVSEIATILKGLYPSFEEDFFYTQCQHLNLPLHQKTSSFSTGMKAKLKTIIAISHGAKLLILDEPTAGLDVMARNEVLDLLYKYMEKEEDRAILISSHISSDLEHLCDDLYMIEDGAIIFHETCEKLLSEYAILKVDDATYEKLEKQYILKTIRENFGYRLLTNEKQFYLDNYPGIAIEKGAIDELIPLMIKGGN